MRQRTRASKLVGVAAGAGLTLALVAGTALATTTPSRDADVVTQAFIESAPPGSVLGSSFDEIPPNGNPAGTSDSKLASFPVTGERFAILSTGNVNHVESPDDSDSTSTDNNGGGGGHGGAVFDLVQLRVNLDVPPNRNCLTFDFRLLSEEFPEFIGSEFNDGFVAELDKSDFTVESNGDVTAPNNIAADENGKVVTVNTTGTSADNAIGTTFDGATPILSGTTPLTAGPHTLYLSIYDANDAVYDSAVFIDNLRLRSTPEKKCKRGASPTSEAGTRCKGEEATVIASDGVAVGTGKSDVIIGTSGKDVIRGKGGNDLICGKAGNDVIRGGDGNDVIVGNKGHDEIRGNAGKDDLGGGQGKDELFGQKDDDRVVGGKNDDVLHGNGGDDNLKGHRGDDELNGNRGNDVLRGNGGDNVCRGGPGDDTFGKGC